MSETRRERGAAWSAPAALGAAGLALAVLVALGVAYGTETISISRALGDPASLDHAIALRVRLPRVLLAAITGGGLAMVGVAFQAILRNPLAEPYTLGVSGGAALGATIAILFGANALTIAGASLLPLAAFAGGVGATALVYGLARVGGAGRGYGMSGGAGTSILLAGIVVNAIAGAAITFLKTLVSATKAQELLFWLMGFLDVPSVTSLVSVAVYVAVGGAVLLRDAGRLNLLALGDEPAQHLGVDVRALERRTFLVGSLVVGAIVSTTGLIGFVGLIVPHALRRVVGPDTRVLLPASLLAGGAVLVGCDLFSRELFQWLHTEPPVGAVTAMIGGPVFLVLLRRRAYG
ncbi:MAG: FecCD family ABC transporter permease [Polyangiaceae bacterium]